MKFYQLQKTLINSIRKKHIELFGWIGLGNLFKTPNQNGYYIRNKYPKLDIYGLKEKKENLEKVLKFYYFLKRNVNNLYKNGIYLTIPLDMKYKIEEHQIFIYPDDKEGDIFFAYGEYIEREPLEQINALLSITKEELKSTSEKIKNLEREIQTNKTNLLVY